MINETKKTFQIAKIGVPRSRFDKKSHHTKTNFSIHDSRSC